MTIERSGADIDRAAAVSAAEERAQLISRTRGTPLALGNEFSEVTVRVVETRNGTRLLIDAPKSGQWIALDPLELEALTWQTVQTFCHPCHFDNQKDQSMSGVAPPERLPKPIYRI